MDAHGLLVDQLLLCLTPEQGVMPVRRGAEPVAGVRLVAPRTWRGEFDILNSRDRVVARSVVHPRRCELVRGPDGERLLELRFAFWASRITVLVPDELTVQSEYQSRSFAVLDRHRDLVATICDTSDAWETGDFRIRPWRQLLTVAQAVGLAQFLRAWAIGLRTPAG